MQVVLEPRGLIYKSDGHFATVFACYDSKHSYLDLFTLVILPAIFVAMIFFIRSHQKW